MMPDFDNTKKWWDFLTTNMSIFWKILPWLIIVCLIYIIIKYPENLQIIASWFQRLFANCSSKLSKKSIENELQGRVLKASKAMCKELEEVLPYSIKIEWVKETNKKSFFDDNRVIICMDHNRTRNQNIVYAITDYVSNGLLPTINLYIDGNIMKSSKLVLSRKLISISYSKGLSYFLENIFLVETEKDPEIKRLVEELIRLDDGGMFIQILIREYMDKGHKFALGVIKKNFQEETRSFLQFLYTIANRETGEETPLVFNGDYFKVGIILIASDFTYFEYGSNPYIKRFNEDLRLGLESIYLYSRGETKVSIALKICKLINEKHPNLDKPKVFHYNGRYKNYKPYKGICIAYNNIDLGLLKSLSNHGLNDAASV